LILTLCTFLPYISINENTPDMLMDQPSTYDMYPLIELFGRLVQSVEVLLKMMMEIMCVCICLSFVDYSENGEQIDTQIHTHTHTGVPIEFILD
jgi:hypothetical protein